MTINEIVEQLQMNYNYYNDVYESLIIDAVNYTLTDFAREGKRRLRYK